MTSSDIVAGKAGFQKADLMDYGSLYGMGSYFGEDYTASVLVDIARHVEAALLGVGTDALLSPVPAETRAAMQSLLRHVDLSRDPVVLPAPVAAAIEQVREGRAEQLLRFDDASAYTKAYSLDRAEALEVADFLVYSALTTVALRPDAAISWTSNWPPEPLVGNEPPTGALIWTVISLGTGHHLFWGGEPEAWLAVGGVFSFLEVLPLFLLVLEGLSQRQKLRAQRDFPYRLAFLFIIGSVTWNFIGAGAFGGIINASIVNYYQHATFLTLNHAHTSMFGAFGLLAIGLIYLALRYMAGDRVAWSDRLGVWAFWLYNAGLVWR
jgi:nitric oxide reductase large subunit